jgi:hypothetical protein
LLLAELAQLAAGTCERRIDVDQDHQIGLEAIGGGGQNGAREAFGQASPVSAQHLGRVQETIGQY